MNAGEIGKEAGRIFEYKLPANWIARSQEDQDDHGIDYEIEIKDAEGKALGEDNVFKIQVKGEENCSFIKDGQVVSHSIKVERLKYYLSFNIPVILVVVDVTLERVFWLSITDSEIIREQIESTNDENKSVHLPIQRELIRKDNDSFLGLIAAVKQCWDYLSIRGIRKAVSNYLVVRPDEIDKCINDIGDAFFKAHHVKLDRLFLQKEFKTLYEQASQIFQSPIVPAKDRFIALAYFAEAFEAAPYKTIKVEQISERLKVKEKLVHVAREVRSNIYGTTAIGKLRIEIFKIKLEQLHALHFSNANFDSRSIEYMLMDGQTHQLYLEVCKELQKLIILCNRLISQSQFDVLASLFVELAQLLYLFKMVHSARGSKQSIDFLEEWHSLSIETIIAYVSSCGDYRKLGKIYFLYINEMYENRSKLVSIRELVLKLSPDAKDMLDEIEVHVKDLHTEHSFYDSSPEEQKAFFLNLAKSLGMDPDDSKSKEGQFVKIGLQNYDPSNVMKNCESLFVHYKPRGMIAQQLGMHSLGMITLVCLKHHYVSGGWSLAEVYDQDEGPDFLKGFKQNHCDQCKDCVSRPDSWNWSLKWHGEEAISHKPLLDKFSAF
ncbi:hypothetical protein F892_02360 [Acinetobacter vivianii]|uniref:DUF4365 domain-containing protein n=1 Tax=Acinetobacter vivianii TaxID=1776742 RepID=N9Q873_9GAMM|nr:DUF4365 domain-containing protein [Acinetobacter vivianii]ENX23117.1 hypothetical protein F892_02360 [Acinetobacter vivianii]GGI60568.1 hypothetical protein GCM10011446_20630 [Acinetobacter vivianii]